MGHARALDTRQRQGFHRARPRAGRALTVRAHPPCVAGGGELLPLRQLQGQLVMRLREDIIPRAQIYYIGHLQGVDIDDDAAFDDDEWDDGPEPPPPRGGRMINQRG